MSKTRMGKRAASLLLSLVMMLSLLPTAVYAAGADEVVPNDAEEVIAPAANTTEDADAPSASDSEDDKASDIESAGVSEQGPDAANTTGDESSNGADAGDAADSALTTQSGDTEMPVTYAAGETETVVAKIGDTEYATLKDAVADAGKNDTITLVDNITVTDTLAITKAVTLNLAGKAITGALTIGANGNLTINDSVGGGTITSAGTTITAQGGTLTLNGGTIESTSTSSSSAAIALAFNVISAVHINDGVVQNSAKGGVAIIVKNGSFATLTVANGTVSGDTYGIDLWNSTKVSEIAGGTITGGTAAIRMRANAKLNAIGGEIKGIGISGGSTALTIGKNENGAASDVTVDWVDLKHATTSNANAATVYLYSGTVDEFENYGSMTVKEVGMDGAFLTKTKDISDHLPGNLTCEPFGDSGYYCVNDTTVTNAAATITRNGAQLPYNTVEQAVQALADGDTLTLNTDYTGTISTGAKNITIDLGGHTVTNDGWGGYAINLVQSTTDTNTVTVKNGTIVAKGQGAAGIFAKLGGSGSTYNGTNTLTLALGEDLTIETRPGDDANDPRYGKVKLGDGARIAGSDSAYINRGGLQVVENGETWIYGATNTAFTHANGSTVTLLNDWYNTDYDGAVRVPEDASYTSAVLDLNGNTIGYYGSVSAIAIGGSGNNYVDGTNAKSLTVKNGTINANSGSGAAIGGSNKTLILDGVTLTTTGTDKYGIFTNGMTTGNTVTLTNSSITAEKGTGIYFPGAGTLTVENTNVTGSVSGIEIRAGELHVSGTSAITSTAAEFELKDNDNGTTTTGAAIAAVKHGVGNDLTVNITGGTMQGVKALYQADPNADKAGSVTMSVTGGTFRGVVTAETTTKFISGGTFSTAPAAAYLADGCTAKDNDDGTQDVVDNSVASVGGVKYATLPEAIKAAQNGETVTLLKNIKLTAMQTISGSKAFTLDLNGHNINATGTALELDGSTNMTVQDTSKTASGMLYGDYNGIFVAEKATLTVKSGTVKGGSNAVLNSGTVNIEGTAKLQRDAIFSINCETGSTVNMTGGKVFDIGTTESAHSYTVKVSGGEVENYVYATSVTGGTIKDLILIKGGQISNATINGYIQWLDNTVPTLSSVTLGGDAYVKNEGYCFNSKKTAIVPSVAKIGNTEYATLPEAIKAAKDGDTVKLLADVEQNARLVIDKSITLDLNGKKICNTRDIWDESNALIGIGTDETRVQVTITGSGTIAAKENDCYTIDVKNGDLTIENGEFIGNVSAVQVQTGTLTINGGKFSLLQKWEDKSTYLINCIDDYFADGSAKVAIYGGTFVDFDPNVSPEKQVDGKTPSFAAPGVGVKADTTDGTFTALPNKVAQTLDANGNSVYCYDSLEGALRLMEVKDGYTVRVLQDITVENQLPAVTSSITIDGQGYTVTLDDSYAAYISVEQNYKLKLSNVTITGATDIAPLLHIKGNAEVTIDKDSSIIATGDNKDSNPAIFIGVENGASGTAPTLNIYGRVEGNVRGVIAGNGTDNGTSYINIYDGAVVKSKSLAMFLPQPCEVNISGGTVEGYCAIGIKSGTLNITGGQVLGVADDYELSDSNSVGNGMEYDGSAIVIDSNTGYTGDVNISISGSARIQSRFSTGIREIGNDAAATNVTALHITGGTVLSGSGMAAVQVRDVTAEKVSITGGSFSTDVSGYCAADYQCNAPTGEEPLYTVTKVEEIKLRRTLTIASDLIMTYTAEIPDKYQSPYAEFNFWNCDDNDWQNSRVDGVYEDGKYTFAFTGINPQRMNDTLKVTLYAATEDNKTPEAITAERTDSVAAYCTALMNSSYNAENAWTELISDLVAYGTASQKYMKYNLSALVEDSVPNVQPVSHKEKIGDITAVSGVSKTEGGITIESVGMVLSSSYAVRVYFTLGDAEKERVAFTVKVENSAVEQTFTAGDFTQVKDDLYYFEYTGLNARQLDSRISVASTVNGAADDALEYSANTYLAYYLSSPSANTKWNDLAETLFSFGWICNGFKG